MRTSTPHREWVDDDGHRHTTITVQRVCNGCGDTIGDVTDDEMNRAIDGLPLVDVRDECPRCALFLPEERADRYPAP